MRKTKTGKDIVQLNFEREQRFYASLQKIYQGITRKQAILQSGMDPRTFNKLLQERTGEGSVLLTREDKRGHYRIGLLPGSVSTWRTLDNSGHGSLEYFDKKYTRIMGQYWNAVENYLYYRNKEYLDSFKPTIVFTVDGKQIQLMINKQALKFWWDSKSFEEQTEFNDMLYVKDSSYES